MARRGRGVVCAQDPPAPHRDYAALTVAAMSVAAFRHLNVPASSALARLVKSARVWPEEGERLTRLRERFVIGVMQGLTYTYLNGHPTQRLPNNVNLSFAGVDGRRWSWV